MKYSVIWLLSILLLLMGGISAAHAKPLTVPTISSFSPTSGDVGYKVTLTGSSFTGATAVKFNGVSASSFVVNSDTQITAYAPSGAASGTLSVTTPGGTGTSSTSFTFYTRPNFPGLADSSTGLHLYMPFNTTTTPAQLAASSYPVDMVWGWNNGSPTSDPGIYKTYYMPFDRDEDTRYYSQAHDLAWYKANHPDWIEYTCAAAGVSQANADAYVAYEFGTTTSMPLDRDNSAEQAYIESTYITPQLAAGTGWSGIGFDNLVLTNGGSYSGQRCGHYNSSGTWVSQYSGTTDDSNYRASVVSWTSTMQSWFHAHESGKMFEANFSPDQNHATDSQSVVSHIDMLMDENGSTNGNNAPPWQYLDTAWTEVMHEVSTALHTGTGVQFNNQEPVSFSSVTNAEAQWAIANYLLLKSSASGMWVCGSQEYGQLFIRPEYSAASGIGMPTDDYYLNSAGVYQRDFSLGLALVNPSSTTSHTVTLPSGAWKDLYGTTQGSTVTLGAGTAIVLLGANIVQNPSFETGTLSPWTSNVSAPAAGTVTVDSTTAEDGTHSVKLNVTATSTNWWYVSVRQFNVPIVANHSYTVSFWVKASATRNLTYEVQNSTGTVSYSLHTVSAGTGWTQVTGTFTPTVSDSTAQFWIGSATAIGTLWADNVSLS